jgi:hypothetical protein
MPDSMRRVLVTIVTSVVLAAAAPLVLPGIALGTLSEVGKTTSDAMPSCPNNPCLAVSRTTGYQAKVGTTRGLVTVPRDGSVVAWTITLGKPSKPQISFFDSHEGGTASAAIEVLRPGKHLFFKLIAQSPPVQLEQYFGMTAQFPLATTIPVKKGDVVALAVPTWAPALALGFGNDTSWRASRPGNKCNDTTTQTMHATVGTSVQYRCLYRTARLTYSATLISTP